MDGDNDDDAMMQAAIRASLGLDTTPEDQQAAQQGFEAPRPTPNGFVFEWPTMHSLPARSDPKLVLVVRQDLKMGVGKVAAQCCHASLGVCREAHLGGETNARLNTWEGNGGTTVVLKGSNLQELLDLQKSARQSGVLSYLVFDAGRTQVPSGSATVLALFGERDDVDKITGNLKLL